MQQLSGAMAEAARSEEPWLDRINAGLLALLEFLDDKPRWARLVILERPFEGPAARDCTQRLQHALPDVLSAARDQVVIGDRLEPPAELIAELLATAVFSVIRGHMLRGPGRPLAALAPSLMSGIVAPYLGRGAARADRSSNEPCEGQSPPRPEVVPIRPHPRPVLALKAIASTPALSNEEVGVAVGIDREASGQIAKLLKPLQRRGLIENASLATRPGEPNAWLLTPYGHRALQLLTGRAAPTHLKPEQEATPPPRALRRPLSPSSFPNARADRRAA